MNVWLAIVLLALAPSSASSASSAALSAATPDAAQDPATATPTPTPPPTPTQTPTPPPAADDQPAGGSRALEELLERLLAERSAGGLIAPTTDLPEEPTTATPPAAASAVRRIADSVQVVRADGVRRDLAWWDSRAVLGPGDEVRLDGGRACALYSDGDGVRARFDGRAVWRALDAVGTRPRQFAIDQFARYAEWWLEAGVDCVLRLPGGNECAGNGTRITLHDHDRRAIELRVTGPAPVVVRTPYRGEELVTVAPGQRIFLPALPEPAAWVPHLTVTAEQFDDARGRLRVQAPETMSLAVRESGIALEGNGPVPGIARACGARVVVRPGDGLTLTRVPLGFPRRQEQDE